MSCYQVIKDKGHRLTPQRLAILDVLHNSEGHLTAEDISSQVKVKHPKINRSTVYRTLELMKKLGLANETDLGGDRLYYHHAEKGHHHHLVCQKCGRIFEVEEEILEQFKEFIVRKYNFLPDMRHLAIFGRCLTCQ